jgi:hypothetical protein
LSSCHFFVFRSIVLIPLLLIRPSVRPSPADEPTGISPLTRLHTMTPWSQDLNRQRETPNKRRKKSVTCSIWSVVLELGMSSSVGRVQGDERFWLGRSESCVASIRRIPKRKALLLIWPRLRQPITHQYDEDPAFQVVGARPWVLVSRTSADKHKRLLGLTINRNCVVELRERSTVNPIYCYGCMGYTTRVPGTCIFLNWRTAPRNLRSGTSCILSPPGVDGSNRPNDGQRRKQSISVLFSIYRTLI